jgi:hypothetical protein
MSERKTCDILIEMRGGEIYTVSCSNVARVKVVYLDGPSAGRLNDFTVRAEEPTWTREGWKQRRTGKEEWR